jgi:hypothetical protein
LSFPLVGNPSDLFGIVKKDCGQAAMTEKMNVALLMLLLVKVSKKFLHS